MNVVEQMAARFEVVDIATVTMSHEEITERVTREAAQNIVLTAHILVDEIGQLDAQIAKLQDERNAKAALVKSLGDGKYSGTLWNACVFTQHRNLVDWRAVAAHFKTASKFVSRHTTAQQITAMKLTGK